MPDDTTPQRPEPCDEEHLVFLDELRESGETNMWGAVPYLMADFEDLTKKQAGDIHTYWMKTFAQRHSL